MANLHFYLDSRGTCKTGEKPLKIALTHNRGTAYHSTGIRLLPEDWDAPRMQVVNRPDKKFLNIEIRKMFAEFLSVFARIESRKDFSALTANEALRMVIRSSDTVDTPDDYDYVVPVYNEYIELCKKASTAQLYKYSLSNLKAFCEDIDTLRFKDINVGWLKRYQMWLTKDREMEANGANVYLRNLRTIFNYALKNEFTKARYPFKDIDMSGRDPDMMEIPYEKFIEFIATPMGDTRDYYKDLFLLSFYLCGIRPVDLLNAKWSQVVDGRLVYCPAKLNGKTKLSVKIEPEAWEIINRYAGKTYLLNVMEGRKD